jgi:uncharacterized protein YdiU (UPF0061 family)
MGCTRSLLILGNIIKNYLKLPDVPDFTNACIRIGICERSTIFCRIVGSKVGFESHNHLGIFNNTDIFKRLIDHLISIYRTYVNYN